MTVLNAAPYYWPEVGGLENVAREITDRLNQRGRFRVVPVASCSCQGVNETHRLDGHTIHLRTDATLYHTPIGVRWRTHLERLIRREQADVVLTHTPVPGMADAAVRAADRAGIPAVLFHHNDLDPRNRLHHAAIGVYRGLLGRRTLELADRILVTSRGYAQGSTEVAPYEDKLAVVPPGVDTDRFTPSDASGTDPAEPEIVFVGRLDKTSSHKGLSLLVQALGELAPTHGFRLSVVGDGDHKQAYEHQAREQGIADRCRFHGFVDDERLPEIYARARAVCLPSTTRSEGFGLVLLEAQAAGTPVIGSDIGGIPQAIEDGETGFLVEPGSIPDLADKLAILIEQPKDAQAMGRRARDRVLERFSWEATADAMEQTLTDVAGTRVDV